MNFAHYNFNHLFTVIWSCAVLKGVFVPNSLRYHILVQTSERVAFIYCIGNFFQFVRKKGYGIY